MRSCFDKQTQNWDKEKCIDSLSRSIDNSRVEYCEDQNRTIVNNRAEQGRKRVVTINPTLFL